MDNTALIISNELMLFINLLLRNTLVWWFKFWKSNRKWKQWSFKLQPNLKIVNGFETVRVSGCWTDYNDSILSRYICAKKQSKFVIMQLQTCTYDDGRVLISHNYWSVLWQTIYNRNNQRHKVSFACITLSSWSDYDHCWWDRLQTKLEKQASRKVTEWPFSNHLHTVLGTSVL